jgi:hypothetical protein
VRLENWVVTDLYFDHSAGSCGTAAGLWLTGSLLLLRSSEHQLNEPPVLRRRDQVHVVARLQRSPGRGSTSRLGVRYVAGTISEADDRLRLTVQLVDATDGCYLWSERYERRVDDIFEVQDQLTQAIVAGMREPLMRWQRGAAESGMLGP